MKKKGKMPMKMKKMKKYKNPRDIENEGRKATSHEAHKGGAGNLKLKKQKGVPSSKRSRKK